jgi:predicted kinase
MDICYTQDMLPQRKLIIQMSGAPGSGKSTLAKSLAESLNGLVISHDFVKSFFLENEISFEQSAALTYGFQWALAKEFIAQGQIVIIIDSTCNYPQTLEQGETLARLCNYEYAYVECRANSLELLEERLKSRVTMRSQRRGINEGPVDAIGARHIEDSRALFQRWIENPCRPASGVIVVNSTNSVGDSLEYVLKQLAISTNGIIRNATVSKPKSGENSLSGIASMSNGTTYESSTAEI